MKSRYPFMLLFGYAIGWVVGTFLPMTYEHKCSRCEENARGEQVWAERKARLAAEHSK